MSTLELLRAPNVGITLYIYAHVMLLAFAYTAISPVFSFTPVHLGGFGFNPLQISLFVSSSLALTAARPRCCLSAGLPDRSALPNLTHELASMFMFPPQILFA
jgi:hypothetical protein